MHVVPVNRRLAQLEDGHYHAALVSDNRAAELIQCWPAADPDYWWLKVTDKPDGANRFTRKPVHVADIRECLRIMGVDPDAVCPWTREASEPLTKPPGSVVGAVTKGPPANQPAKQQGQRWVYFVQAGDAGPIKIGVATNPRSRLSSLQTSTAVPLHPLGVVIGGVAEEAVLHRRFGEFRLRGEWFMPERPLLDYIREEAQSWPWK